MKYCLGALLGRHCPEGTCGDAGGPGEDLKLRAARDLGGVFDLQAETEVGLVRPITRQRLGVGHAHKGRSELDAQALAPDPGAHARGAAIPPERLGGSLLVSVHKHAAQDLAGR